MTVHGTCKVFSGFTGVKTGGRSHVRIVEMWSLFLIRFSKWWSPEVPASQDIDEEKQVFSLDTLWLDRIMRRNRRGPGSGLGDLRPWGRAWMESAHNCVF